MWLRHSRLYSKLFESAEKAVEDIPSGATLAVGGFGNCGIPENLINSLCKKKIKDLTLISNNCGVEGYGVHNFFIRRMVKKIIASYVGDNENFELRYLGGDIEVEFFPQGTLAEKLRAGGAGIPGFYCPSGAGTPISEGNFPTKFDPVNETPCLFTKPKEMRTFGNKLCSFEEALKPEFGFVKAWKGDKLGNLVYRGTARNFNPLVAMAAKTTIAEVEHLVEPGELEPNEIHTPGIYVQRILKGSRYEKKIERLNLDIGASFMIPGKSDKKPIREKIINRTLKELKPNSQVQIGIGLPTLIPSLAPKELKVMFLSETGIFGTGFYPKPGNEDPDLINGGKETCTILPGGAFFDSAESAAMIRGGHLDLAIVGSVQISSKGDLANWFISGKMVKGIGSNMDVAISGTRILVMMEHYGKNSLRITKECYLPLTARKVISMLITELSVFVFENGEITLKEIAEGATIEKIKNVTECSFKIDPNLKTF
jgi:3-oxoacid CoA-transferase